MENKINKIKKENNSKRNINSNDRIEQYKLMFSSILASNKSRDFFMNMIFVANSGLIYVMIKYMQKFLISGSFFIIGVIILYIALLKLKSYQLIIQNSYSILQNIEEKLPEQMFLQEYENLYNSDFGKQYVSSTKIYRNLVIGLISLYSVLFITAAIQNFNDIKVMYYKLLKTNISLTIIIGVSSPLLIVITAYMIVKYLSFKQNNNKKKKSD